MASDQQDATILNVDDDEPGRYVVTHLLRSVGYHVLEASRGREALELAAREPVDLVLLDVNLPDLNGYEVARHLRADPQTSSVPILHLSATAVDPACMVAGLESGADAYLCEPVTDQVLLAQVSTLLRMRRLYQELAESRARAEEQAAQLATALDQLRTTNEELQSTNEEFETANEELEAANEELQTAQDELEQQQEALVQRTQTLEAISRVLDEALSAGSDEELGETILAVARELTGSQVGFIGEVGPSGSFHDLAIGSPSWGTCTVYNRADPPRPSGRFAIHGLYQSVLSAGKGFFTNDPAAHASRLGLPEGLPPLSSFLGVPLCQMGQAFGLIAVGNRPGGYTERELRGLEALAPAMVQAIQRKRGEEALRASEEQFRSLADSIPNLAWWANADGYITWYNRRWYEYTGTTPEQMEGWGWQSVHDPEVLPAVLERWKESIATGEPFEMTFPLRGADGAFRPFLTRVEPVRDSSGQVVRWFGTNTDISPRLELEAQLELRAQEAEEGASILEALMEHIPEGITLADAPDVTIRRVSAYGRALTTRPAEQLEGIPAVEDTHSEAWGIYHLDHATKARDEELPLTRATRQGEHVRNEEWVLRRTDGTDIIILCDAVPILNRRGEITGGLIAWRDITERKRIEEALRESEERLTLAVEATGLGTFDYFPQTGQLIWSDLAKRHFGLPPEATVDYGVFLSGLHPEDRERVTQVLQGALRPENGGQYRIEYRTIGLEDGLERWLLAEGRVLFDAQGRAIRLIGATLDITARRQAEQALRESEGRFRGLFESMLDGFTLWEAIVGPDGEPADFRLVAANPAWEQILYYRRERVVGQSLTEAFPSVAAFWREVYGRVLASGQSQEGETRAAAGPWIAYRAYSPRPGQVAMLVHDITQRRQAEEEREALLREIQEQRALLETIIENAGSSIAYYGPDFDIRIVNEAYTRNVGRPREELMGKRYPELLPNAYVEEEFRRVVETKQPFAIREMPYVFAERPERGTVYYDWRLVPLLNAQGEVEGVVSSTIDVTESVRQRQRIEDTERQHLAQARFLAAFLDNAPVPMAYLDAELRFVRVNQAYAEWAGLPAEQLVDHTHFEVWHVEERVETLRHVLTTGEPVRRSEMPLSYPRRLNRPQGYVDYAAFPVKDEAGRAVGLVLSVEDVTERVHQREQLLAAERARAELAENLNREIAHRTKNNLAMAAGLLQLQIFQQRDPEVGTALSETMARLMTFASIQEEMQSTTGGWVDLLPVLRRVGSASSGAFAGGDVVVSVRGRSLSLPSKVATNLAVVANELVTNAIKHGAPDADGKLRVEVELEQEEDLFRLCVWNSGNPVPEGFDPAAQRGLGLQLVRDLAATHVGGRFQLRPQGDGTVAEVAVPLEELRGAYP